MLAHWSLAPTIGLLALAAPALSGCTVSGTVGFEDDGHFEPNDTSSVFEPGACCKVLFGDVLLDLPGPDCSAPLFLPCDESYVPSFAQVLGAGCPGDDSMLSYAFRGHADAVTIHEGPLDSGSYSPQEGKKIIILSTGRADEVPLNRLELGCISPDALCLNSGLTETGLHDLPRPLSAQPATDAASCDDEFGSILHAVDCSNTIAKQWQESGCTPPKGGEYLGSTGLAAPRDCALFDYADIRIKMVVPAEASGIAFDFAFLSAEYPQWVNAPSNDMFVAWLDSESWTGNISFDGSGNPISPRSAAEALANNTEALHGSGFEGHGATRWLTSSAQVTAGESIELVFAIFDMADNLIDSAVLLDHLRWTCSDSPPSTILVW